MGKLTILEQGARFFICVVACLRELAGCSRGDQNGGKTLTATLSMASSFFQSLFKDLCVINRWSFEYSMIPFNISTRVNSQYRFQRMKSLHISDPGPVGDKYSLLANRKINSNFI
jgi:hypothetical protein